MAKASVIHETGGPEALKWRDHARDLSEVVGREAVKTEMGRTCPLAEPEQAHRDLEGRKTTGPAVLMS